jgi:hypothetical protein
MSEIVPAVSAADLANIGNLADDLSLLQRVVKADKSVIVATLVHVGVLCAAYFGLKLTAQQIAIMGSIVAGGLGLLMQMHFTTVAKVSKR